MCPEEKNRYFSWCILRTLNMYGVNDPSNPQGLRILKSYDCYDPKFKAPRGENDRMGKVANLATAIKDGKLPSGVSYSVLLQSLK